jgi:hypothetical protein
MKPVCVAIRRIDQHDSCSGNNSEMEFEYVANDEYWFLQRGQKEDTD